MIIIMWSRRLMWKHTYNIFSISIRLLWSPGYIGRPGDSCDNFYLCIHKYESNIICTSKSWLCIWITNLKTIHLSVVNLSSNVILFFFLHLWCLPFPIIFCLSKCDRSRAKNSNLNKISIAITSPNGDGTLD